MVLIYRVSITIGSILGIKINNRAFSDTYWIVRGAGLGWQCILIILVYKWPLIFSKIAAPALIPSYLITIVHLHAGIKSIE